MKVTTLILALFIPIALFAQSEKTTIAILEPTPYNTSYADDIRDAVTEGFTKTKRFDVIDRSSLRDIEKEVRLQAENDAISLMTDFGKGKGVQYFISININSITAEAMYITNSETNQKEFNGYKAKISFLLKVIDLSTTKTIASENIVLKEGNLLKSIYKKHETMPSAITDGISKIGKQIDEFVDKNFPATFFVVEVLEQKKNKAKSVLISGGSEFGVEKGDKLKVVEISTKEVNGKVMKRTKEIGKIKVSKVDDENFSQCKVTEGGDVIFSKLNGGAQLTVITLN